MVTVEKGVLVVQIQPVGYSRVGMQAGIQLITSPFHPQGTQQILGTCR
jgi:hypothetical protein